MKDFNEFVKTLPNSDIAETVQKVVEKSASDSANDTEKLAKIIATTSTQITLNILAEYHKWIQQP